MENNLKSDTGKEEINNSLDKVGEEYIANEKGLIEISKFTDTSGFEVPVVITEPVWSKYINWHERDNRKQYTDHPQSLESRLQEVLWMLYVELSAKKVSLTEGLISI